MSMLLRRGIISNGGNNILNANTSNLNGSSQYFDAGNPTELQITGNITMETWINFGGTPSSDAGIFTKFNSTGDQRSVLVFYDNATDELRAFLYTTGVGGVLGDASTGSTPPTGWFHFAVVYNGSTIKIYINAVEEASTAYSGGIFDSTSSWFIGARDQPTPDIHLDGSMALPRIWDSDLSAAQITELYNNSIPKCTSALTSGLKTDLVYAPRLANWGSNVGSELTDQSTSGITTTNVGSTPFTGTGLKVEC